MHTERRMRKRVPFVFWVALEVGNSKKYYYESRDISMVGIFLMTNSPLPIGTKGKITMILECRAEKSFIHAHCEVTRVVPPESDQGQSGIGLQFTSIEPESSIHLYNVQISIRLHYGWSVAPTK